MYIYGNTWFGDPFLGEIRISLRNSTASGLNLTRAQLVLEILMVLMCVGAVAGNILVIVIVAATKTFHSVTSVLIINLAISDFLVGIGVMPFVAVSIMNNEWVNCTDLCLYVGYTSSVYCTASVLTLAAIALDRYYCIVDCLHYDTRCTAWRTGAVVLWIWLQAVVTSCPPLLGWSSVSFMGPMYSCTVNWASSPSYTALMAVLSFLLPGAVILFCYVKIVRVARSHAKRIHSLEEHIQRGRGSSSTSSFSPSSSPPSRGARRSTSPDSGSSSHSASRLVYYVSGRFVSEARVEGPGSGGPPMDSTGPQGGENSSSPNPSGQHLHSFFAHLQSSGPQRSPQRTPQRTPQPAPQARPHSQSQQSQLQHNGLLRLFMVIAAFFLCWTPYICVALVQATETALSRPATQVPPTAVTFSFWLLLFNSDLNPLLYALLSKRFQGALWSLRQKVQARLGRIVGRGNEERLNEGVRRESNPSNHTAPHPASQSSNDTSSQEGASYSSVLSLNSHFPSGYKEQLGDVLLPRGVATSSCSLWPACGETAPRSLDCLQVPSLPKEGGRLPYSAASKERQATFFYGQITVRVEHDMC